MKPFYNSKDTQLINTQITLDDGTNEYKFSNLYIGTIEIINTGLIDFENFLFGITLPDGIKFIQNKHTPKDRHHNAEISNEPTLTNQTDSFDITLIPFNRKDRYVFDVILTSSNSHISYDCLAISTPKAVKLMKISTIEDISERNNALLRIFFPIIADITQAFKIGSKR